MNVQVAQLEEERQSLVTRIKALADIKDRWGDDEERQWVSLNEEFDGICKAKEEAEARDERMQKVLATLDADGHPNAREGFGGKQSSEHPLQLRDVRSGMPINYCTAETPMPGLDRRFDFGRYAMAVGGNSNVLNDVEREAFRSISTADPGVPEVWSNQLLDNLRAAVVCSAAGGRTVPVPANSLSFVSVTADATSSWLAELAADTESTPTLEPVVLTPYRLQTTSTISMEAFADSINGPMAITQSAVGSAAVAIDNACLEGAGTTEPRGIVNTVGVLTETITTSINWDNVSSMIGKLRSANINVPIASLALVCNPQEAQALRDEKASTGGQFLGGTGWTAAVRIFETTGITAGTAVLGDFTHLFLGYRMPADLRWFDTGTDGVTNLLLSYARSMRLVNRFDCVCAKPSAFCVGTIA